MKQEEQAFYDAVLSDKRPDESNLMMMYQRMGCIIGLMLYSIEQGNADPHLLARQVSRMVTEDKNG